MLQLCKSDSLAPPEKLCDKTIEIEVFKKTMILNMKTSFAYNNNIKAELNNNSTLGSNAEQHTTAFRTGLWKVKFALFQDRNQQLECR